MTTASIRSAPQRILETYTNSPLPKFLIVACNPTLRTYSDYIHISKAWKFDKKIKASILKYGSFNKYVNNALNYLENFPLSSSQISQINDDAIESEDMSFDLLKWQLVTKGLYAEQQKSWSEKFNKDQFIFVDGDKLLTDPGTELEKLQTKLKLNIEIDRSYFVKNPSSGLFCFKSNKTACLHEGKGRTRKADGQSSIPIIAKTKLDAFFRPHNEEFFEMVSQRFDW